MHHRPASPQPIRLGRPETSWSVQRSIWQNCRSGCQADADGLDRVAAWSGSTSMRRSTRACASRLSASFACTRDRRVASTRVQSSLSAAPALQAYRSGRHSVLRNGETAAQSNAYRRSRSAWCRLLVLGVTLSLEGRASHPVWLFHAVPRRSIAGADYAGSARCLLHTPRCR